jgi:hypothetical protein
VLRTLDALGVHLRTVDGTQSERAPRSTPSAPDIDAIVRAARKPRG